ncbi:MAG: hypothetical protein ACRC6E_05975, partial [Fusobacteriaceae bacterium]
MILHISHTDFDMIGCQLVLEHVFGRGEVKTVRCNYTNVNERLKEVLTTDKYNSYSNIIITDISVNEEVASIIESKMEDKVVLIDHHATAEWLNKYDWANVTTHDSDGVQISASKLVSDRFNIKNKVLLDIIRLANDYDCWHWSRNGNMKAKELNDLVYLVGFDEMIDN